MSFAVFLTFIQYLFVMAYTPGPANIYSMNYSMKYGFRRFFRVYAGLYSAFFIIVVSAALLAYGFSQLIPGIARYMTYLGALYLLWLSYHIFRSKPEEESQLNEDKKKSDFIKGFLLNITNVKVMIFCISLFQLYIGKYYENLWELLIWCLPISLIATSSTIVWALLGSKMSASYARHFRLYNGIMAFMLIICIVGLFI